MAQGSAYGAEERFPLKPPVAWWPALLVSWCVLAAATIVGVVLAANAQWVGGGVVLVLTGAAAWYVGPRFHLMSRRWLVVVPAGMVVHDPLLLIENALFRSTTLTAVHLAPPTTEAADLTGGTPGLAIEIVVRDMETIVMTAGRHEPRGKAIHASSVLVAPSRPGRALAAAAGATLPRRLIA